MRKLAVLITILVLCSSALSLAARKQKASNNIVETVAASADHKALASAVKAANLEETLSGPGPYTLFAPTDAAFEKLPADMMQHLDKPANKARLIKVLNYHLLYGRYDSKKLQQLIRRSGARAVLKTVDGAELVAKLDGDHIVLTDVKEGKSKIITEDVDASNGVIHVVDRVLMP